MLDFYSCKEIITSQLNRGLDKKKLANNTYLRKIDESCYAITLHRTDVVLITQRDERTIYRLNSGGYQTVTTKERLNSFSPARIYQSRGVWYVGQPDTDVIYFDGIEVDSSGIVVAGLQKAPDNFLDKKKKLDIMISEYIRGFADDAIENGLGVPDNGDCLLCRIHAQNAGSSVIDDYSHVYSHLEEKYYTRAFLYYCLKLHKYNNPGFIWGLIASYCEKGDDAMLKRELRYGLSKMKSKLIDFVDLQCESRELELVG